MELKINAESNDDQISHNYIIMNLACKYFDINTNIYRTLLINPSDEERKYYRALHKIHKFII